MLGNGFDLAHNLKTSLNDFLNHISTSHLEDRTKYTNLLQIHPNFRSIEESLNVSPLTYGNDGKNKFVMELYRERLESKNWCDIEAYYYKRLLQVAENPNSSYDVTRFNKDFMNLKIELDKYISIENGKSNPIDSYQSMFTMLEKDCVILNFNYTDTYKHYIQEGIDMFNLHGQIGSTENPIIFGYAALDTEIDFLLSKNEDALLENIKKINYKRNNAYDNLRNLLNDPNDFHELWVFGHSCSISDNLILSDLISSESIEKIRIFYYKGYEDYNQKQLNLNRIQHGDQVFDKLVNFMDSAAMPQWDFTNQGRVFLNTIETILHE